MKKALLASFATSALLIGAFAMSAISANAYVFSSNLSVGSSGADVTALQSFLVSKGFLTMPAGVSMGWFGSLTKAAVVAYQASEGIVPTSGYVGPLTRAQLNAGGGTAMVPNCPTGVVCTPNPVTTTFVCPTGWSCVQQPGSTVTPGSTATGITTIGVPGILSVSAGPLSSSVLNVGAQKAPILDIRVQAQYSDLAVQSMTLDLGNSTAFYNKLFSTVYVVDSATGAVLASEPLNASTVVQSGNNYIVGLAGFNVIVPKGTYKDILIEADLNSSVDSAYLAGGTLYPNSGTGVGAITAGWGIGLAAGGLRAVDGAGINLTGPTTELTQSLTINKSLVDNSQANFSVDQSSPLTNSVPVSDTINGNYLGLPVFTFDVYAQNDTLHLHNVAVNIGAVKQSGNTTGIVGAAYLFQGSTQIQSASVVSGVATFSNITDGTSGATIPVGTTVPFTVKVDVTGVTTGSVAITASTSASGTTVYNSIDSNVSNVGSAIGNTITVTGNGPSFVLTSAPSILTQGQNVSGTSPSTSTIIASFPISISSTGLDTYFGTVASTTPAFWFNVIDNTGAVVYTGNGSSTFAGTVNTAGLNNFKVVLPTLPTAVTNGVTQANTFKVANQNTVALGTIQVQFDGKGAGNANLTGGPYKVNMYQVVTSAGTVNFMNGLASWTTTTGTNP